MQGIAEARWTHWVVVLLCVANVGFGLLDMRRTSPAWFGLTVAGAAMVLLVSRVTDRLNPMTVLRLVVTLNLIWVLIRSRLHGYWV